MSTASHYTDSSTSYLHPVQFQYDDSDEERLSCLGLPLSLPYEIETLADMDERLELIVCRLTEVVKARDWRIGFRPWATALNM